MPPVHEQLISLIRAAFDAGATLQTKIEAANACRMLLAVLVPAAAAAAGPAAAGPTTDPTPPPTTAPSAAPGPPTAPLDVLLDALVAKYGHLVPDDARPASNDIPIIPLPIHFHKA